MEYMDDEDKREYHRVRTQKHREGWAIMGCKSSTYVVPEKHVVYFRGYTTCLTAVHLAEKLKNNDEETIFVLANRRPKYSIMHGEVEVLYGVSDEMDKVADHMMVLLRRAREERSKGQDNLGNPMGLRHFANESVLVYYLKGYYDLTLYLMNGSPPPPFSLAELDLSFLEARSSVLQTD